MVKTSMKPALHRLIATASLLFAVALIAVSAQDKSAAPATHGISVENMDRSFVPAHDFYLYANGGWLKRTVIPPDRASIGVFSRLGDIANKRTAGIIEDAAKSQAAAGSTERQIADLYNSYMKEDVIESRGLAPLQTQLALIKAIKTKRDLARALGRTIRADVDALNNTNFHTPNLFGLWTAPGFNDSDHYAAFLLQGGLELPDREYYLTDTPHMREVREKYQTHVSAMLKLAGFTDTDARAKRIFDLEHSIAEKHLTLAENDDIHKANNTWKQVDFTAKAPGLDWSEYFHGAGLEKQAEFTVWQPTAFVGESALVESVPLDTWKDWLAYHLIEDYAGVLPKTLAQERFNFFGKVLSGTPQQRPRWQRGVFVVDGMLGDAV